MEDLKTYQGELKNHLKELSLENAKLRDTFELLKSHPETVTLAARDLGYFKANEKVMKIRGLKQPDSQPISPGKIIFRNDDLRFQSNFFRMTWVLLLVLCYILTEFLFRFFKPVESFLGASKA